jgi:peptidoglycan/xylan/chitin deacetylase (PgdA/CDA1 family)
MTKFRILTYHRIGVPRRGSFEALTVPPQRLAQQLRIVQMLRYEFLGLDDLCLWFAGEQKMAKRPVVITFDDGYGDIYEHAFALLQAWRLPAVVFLVANRKADSWREWGDQGPLQLLSWSQIKVMAAAGIVFGSHSLTHARLSRCNAEQLRAEVIDSKKMIEDQIGRRVNHFCYPYGDFDQRIQQAVQAAGYDTACTTARGAVLPGTNPWQLPRLAVGKRMRLERFLLRLVIGH